MGDWASRMHHYIARGSPVNVIPPWILNRAIDHLIDKGVRSTPPQRKIECYEFDPYCFAPHIDGYHAQIAYGQQGMPLLKKKLTGCRDRRQIGIHLNSLCSLVHDPEHAIIALKLNFFYQIRRLMTHKSGYVRQRSLLVLKVLAGQPSGRIRIVNDEKLMHLIIASLKDPRSSVKRVACDLINRLSQYYFAVPKLIEYDFIRIIMDILKDNFIDQPEGMGKMGEFEELAGEENEVEPGDATSKLEQSLQSNYRAEPGNATTKLELSQQSDFKAASQNRQVSMTDTEGSGSQFEEDAEASKSEMNEQREEDMETEEHDELGEEMEEEEESENSSSDNDEDSCTLNVHTNCVLATLLDTLLTLMSANADATLDAICYDAILLKCFLTHESPMIRISTWSIFKQIFTTDVGKMALIPHKLLDQMIQVLSKKVNQRETKEVMGTLMLALIKVENRVAAWKCGILNHLIGEEGVTKPTFPQHRWLGGLSVLAHLAELPEVRKKLQTKLPDIGRAIAHNNCKVDERHTDSLIERVLWKP